MFQSVMCKTCDDDDEMNEWKNKDRENLNMISIY